MRAIQGHSGGNKVDPSLPDDVLIPYKWGEYFYHVGSSLSTCILFFNQDWLQEEKMQKKEDKRSSSLHWIPWAMSQTKSTKICRGHDRCNTKANRK